MKKIMILLALMSVGLFGCAEMRQILGLPFAAFGLFDQETCRELYPNAPYGSCPGEVVESTSAPEAYQEPQQSPVQPPVQEQQIPEIPRPTYQMGMCSLLVVNETHISWDVEVNGSKIGTLNSWSQMEAPCPCDSVMLKLYGTGFNFSRTLSKAFYPNERSGNRFIYRIR